jgi:predicted glycogen debranching enzyme
MITVLDSDVTKNFDVAKTREWIVTNGLGSYASSTIISLNTRGYHGLLVASLDPPIRRTLFVSKYEEEIEVGGRKYLLAVNNYPGIVYPQGYVHLEQFRFDRHPTFVYRTGDTIIEKSLFMPYGDNTTITTYKILESEAEQVKLSIFPLINYRDHHLRTHADWRWSFVQTLNPKGVEIRMIAGAPLLYLQSDIATYYTTGQWYRNFIYEMETQRGIADREDQYNPGYFVAKLDRGSQLSILASLRKQETFSTEGLRYRDMTRTRKLMDRLSQEDPFLLSLAAAADSFIVKRRSTNAKTIIAGYHWFSDWGRDSMISLPGLTLVTKREDEGKEIIRSFLSYLVGGLIPNTFPEEGHEPVYNSIDAPLWLVNACLSLYEETGSLDFIAEVYSKMVEIIDSYSHGTSHGISVDTDGLVKGGSEREALTWMDAVIEGTPVSPRYGKPVEISALWFNALEAMVLFAKQLEKPQDEGRFREMASKTFDSFTDKFWNESKSCLHDTLVDDKGDNRVRPNQMFAIALPFPVLKKEKWREVLRTVETELLTPVGLRSLSPFDAEYKGKCEGSPKERDSAYHQGTVWPWLFGAYVISYLKVYPPDQKSISFVQQLYSPFRKRMTEAGIGTIGEIYDGDPPHAARGAISQAWSIAEILRSYSEEALQTLQ